MDAQANPYLSPGQPEPPAAPVAEIPESIWIPRVASGLGTIVVGTLLMLLADVVSQTLRSQVSLPFSTLQQGVSFIYAAAAIWVFVGLMSCRATPIDAKVRGAIRVSLGATILLAALAMMELTHLGFNSKIVWYWWVARPLASSIGFLAFGYYVLRLAKFLGDAALASESRVAIAATIFFGLAPLSFEAYLGISWALRSDPGGLVPGVFLLFFLISYWLALALYVRLCVQVRAVIRTRIQSSRHLTTEHPAQIAPSAQEWLRDSLTSRKRVGVGLTASWAGIVTFLLAAAMPVVSWRLRELGWASTSAFAAMDVVAAAGIGLKLIGALACLATPEQSAARAPVQIAAVAAMLAVFLKISALLVQAGILKQSEVPLGTLESFFDAAWAVVFLIYLKRLAVFIGWPGLNDWFVPLLIAVIALPVLDLPFALRQVVMPRTNFVYYCVATVHALGFYGQFVVYIFYATVLWRFRRAISPWH